LAAEYELFKVLSLHRYFDWSEHMRKRFEALTDAGVQISVTTTEGQEAFCYLAYWQAGLYVVVEGWRDLGFADATIDSLVASPNVEHLRRLRNGAFHYQRDFFDSRFLEIANAPGTAAWLYELVRAFDRWLATYLNQCRPREGNG
jgi:hypothetical protein